MLVWLVLVIVAAGCGRVGFDDLSDDLTCVAPVGHDEDHDGVDDACDGCPHIAEAQPIDSDNDGVNDPCDPNPMSARERIVAFDPFVGSRPEWDASGTVTPTYTNDSLVVDARGAILYVSRPFAQVPSADVFELGGAAGAGTGPDSKLTTVMSSAGTPYYYCELYDQRPPLHFDLAWTLNGTDYLTGAVRTLQGPFENGAFTITMNVAPPNVSCQTQWPPGANIPNPIPNGIDGVAFAFQAYNFELRADYFIQIHSD